MTEAIDKYLLSMIIPWRNRPELAVGLRRNRQVLLGRNRELIVVNGGGDLECLRRILVAADLPHATIIDAGCDCFNRCACLNLGVFHGGGTGILTLDCDIVVSEELLQTAIGALNTTNFITFGKAVETDPTLHPQTLNATALGLDNLERPWLGELRVTTEIAFLDGRCASIEFWQSRTGRSLGGLILLRKHHYVAVGGSNSNIHDWGFDDLDLHIRLQAKLGLKRVSLGTALHLTHPVVADWAVTNTRNMSECFENYRQGRFLGTYASDMARWGPSLERYSVRGGQIEHLPHDAVARSSSGQADFMSHG